MSITHSNNIQLESQEHFNLNEQTPPSLLSLTELVQLKKNFHTNYVLTYIKDYKRKLIEKVLVTYQRQLQEKNIGTVIH